jgi:hypothetical protein
MSTMYRQRSVAAHQPGHCLIRGDLLQHPIPAELAGVAGFLTGGLFVPNHANIRITDLIVDVWAGQSTMLGQADRI